MSEEWLSDRFTLFEKYCYSSIKSQTYKNFIWILLFSDDTPDRWRVRIEELRADLPCMLPFYLNEMQTFFLSKYLDKIIRDNYDGSDALTTIRLDNDDAVCVDFLKNLVAKREVQNEPRKIYSFKYGLQYYTSANLALRIPYPNNHFLCFVEKHFNKDEEIKTVYSFSHFYAKDYPYPFECIIDDRPMWCEVIHERNVDNDSKMTLNQKVVLGEDSLIRWFGWDVKLSMTQSLINIPFFVFPRFVSQVFRRLKGKLASKNRKVR